MKEADYYQTMADGRVRCTLCPHACVMAEGKTGICRSRINRGGKLYSLAYGNVCSVAVDPVEKKPLLHFHPGMKCLSIACTGCNFHCLNCQNYEISQAAPSEMPGQECTPQDIVSYCLEHRIPAIAYTYTEPLTYLEFIRDIATLAHEQGIYNILVSAGYVNHQPLADLAKVLDAANIDLKAYDDALYRKINGGTLQPVLHTLVQLKEAGVWVEVTNLVIPGVNDKENMIRDMCRWLVANGYAENPLHFSRFFPLYRMTDKPVTPLDTLLRAREIAQTEGMKYVYIGNVQEIEAEDTHCPQCGALLVKRDGYRIISDKLSATGRCPTCGTTISGEW